MKPPQALTTTYPARLQTFSTTLITPAGPTPTGPTGAPSAAERSSGRTKRGGQVVNYAEVDGDDDFEHDAESRAAMMAGAQSMGGMPGAIGHLPGVEAIKRPIQLIGKPMQPRYHGGGYRYVCTPPIVYIHPDLDKKSERNTSSSLPQPSPRSSFPSGSTSTSTPLPAVACTTAFSGISTRFSLPPTPSPSPHALTSTSQSIPTHLSYLPPSATRSRNMPLSPLSRFQKAVGKCASSAIST